MVEVTSSNLVVTTNFPSKSVASSDLLIFAFMFSARFRHIFGTLFSATPLPLAIYGNNSCYIHHLYGYNRSLCRALTK